MPNIEGRLVDAILKETRPLAVLMIDEEKKSVKSKSVSTFKAIHF